MTDRIVLVICGLNREARLAAGPGVLAIAGGADSAGLQRRLAERRADDVAGVVSFGLAGALDPALRVGEVLAPRFVAMRGGRTRATSEAIRLAWRTALGAEPRANDLVGVDAPVLDPGAKARLKTETGAVAVDMESHIAAAYAARIGVPFAALRVVSDGASRPLPPAAGIAMRPDGSVDLAGVLASLARQPGQIPALLATARDAGIAFRELRRVRGLLGPGFGLHL